MHPYLKQALDDIDDATAHLDVARIARAVSGKWSVVEILDHLCLAFSLSARALDKAADTCVPRAHGPSLGQRLARFTIVTVGYFPPVRAPEVSQPDRSVPPERLREAVREAIVSLDATLTRAGKRFGEDTLVLDHPYFAGLSVRQWRKFHWRHAAHHAGQMRERSRP